jgi:MFS transporter, FHS family, L-fucose permease
VSTAAFGAEITGVEWVGYKQTIVLGLVAMGTGALLFIPAASVLSYPLFLTALIRRRNRRAAGI